MKTKERIINAACELFNEHGERTITTNHIASYLGISPGNLYYYFRNKEQIIRAIFTEYETYLSESYGTLPSAGSLMQDYLDNMFQGMWRFRFLYASLADILNRDQELHKRYLTAQQRVLTTGVGRLELLVEHKIMQIEPAMMQPLAEGIKMVVTFWISHLYTQNADKPITESMVYQGVVQVLVLLHGYITPEFKNDFNALMNHYRGLVDAPSEVPLARDPQLQRIL